MTSQEKHQLNESFLQEFPLESLGEMTLDQYSNLNRKDSFCFWIESKTEHLGSVWGGSSFKFGIYRYMKEPEGKDISHDDKYAWNKSLGSTAEEVFAKIRNAVNRLAEYGRTGNIDAIEQEKELWPVIKWKIAYLYSKEKLIPYYSLNRLRLIGKIMGMRETKNATIADIQKYLIKKRGGKDIYEYAYELDRIWKDQKAKASVWLWSGGEQNFIRDRLTAGDSVSHQIRDYSKYKDKKALNADFKKAYGNSGGKIPNAYWKFIKEVQIGDIVVIVSGNTKQQFLYGWGEFISGLINDVESEAPLQREVEWKKKLDTPISTGVIKDTLFFRKADDNEEKEIKKILGITNGKHVIETLSQTMKYQEYIELLKEARNLVLTGAPGTGKTYMAQKIAMEMILNEDVPDDQLTEEQKVKLKKQSMFVQFHPSYDYTDFVEGLRPVNDEGKDKVIKFERRDGVFKEFCKKAIPSSGNPFDKAYGMLVEDIKSHRVETVELKRKTSAKLFVNGDNIKWYSDTESDNISSNAVSRFRLRQLYRKYNTLEKLEGISNIADAVKDVIGGCDTTYYWGILHHLLKNYVIDDSFTPFVFIIDEINRGEASKIFGELFYAIDPGYRGKTEPLVKTQYQNLIPPTDEFYEGFYVPDNVYILATMNDIDRSVESMDFAMRRRFNWCEVTPEKTEAMLDEMGESLATKAKAYMSRLNTAIKETDGLGAAYMIGPAYFKKISGNNGDFEKLWEMNIEPLLREYLRGFRNAPDKMKEFRNKYFNSVSENKEELDEN